MEASAVVRSSWDQLRARSAVSYPYLVPLIDAVLSFPELSGLAPFTSVGRLCFSRCTEFPYDVDFLISYAASRYVPESTVGDGGWVDTMRLGPGSTSPREAAAVVAAAIPPGYGPALLGTREALPPSPARHPR